LFLLFPFWLGVLFNEVFDRVSSSFHSLNCWP
jgi:hypothetical protein